MSDFFSCTESMLCNLLFRGRLELGNGYLTPALLSDRHKG